MATYIHTHNHRNEIGVIIQFDVLDDYTTKTDEFLQLVKELALQITAIDPRENSNGNDELSLLNQSWIKNSAISVRELIQQAESALGTPIKVKRYERYV